MRRAPETLPEVRAALARRSIGSQVRATDLGRAPTARTRAALSYLAQRGFLRHDGHGLYTIVEPITAVKLRRRTCPHCGHEL